MRVAFLLSCLALAASAQDEALETRLIDVSDLTTSLRRSDVPNMDALAGIEQVSAFDEGDASLSSGSLLGYLQLAAPHDGWSDGSFSLSCENGLLRVRATKPLAGRLVAVVAFLRRVFQRRIAVDVELVRFEPGAFAALDVAPGPLGAAAEGRIREALADPKRATLVVALRSSPRNGRSAVATSTGERFYMTGYQPVAGPRASALEPDVTASRVGAVLKAHALALGEGEGARLALRFSAAVAGPVKTQEGKLPGEGSVEQPARLRWSWAGQLAVPSGRLSLLYAASVEEIERGSTLALFARATVSGEAPGDLPLSADASLRFVPAAAVWRPPVALLPARLGTFTDAEQSRAPLPGEDSAGMEKDTFLGLVRLAMEDPDRLGLGFGIDEGHLWISGTRAELEAASQRAAELNVCRLVTVETAVVNLDAAAWEAKRSALSGAADRAALVDAAVRGKGARLSAWLASCSSEEDVVAAQAIDERLFIAALDLISATESASSGARPGIIRGGARFLARARPGADAARMVLTLDAQRADGVGLEDAEGTPFGRVQRPVVRMIDAAVESAIPAGEWHLAGTDLREGETRLLLVRVTRPEAK